MNQKGCRRMWFWPNLRYFPVEIDENHKKLVRIVGVLTEI
jgi:hypothetical protein